MPLDTPESASVVIDRAIADVDAEIEPFGGDAAVENSWIRTLIKAYASRVFEWYYALRQAVSEAFAHSAVDNLEALASDYGINRIQGAPANGRVAFGGIVGSTIPAGAVITAGDGRRYRVAIAAAVEDKVVPVTGITRVGTTATVVTDTPHRLGSQILISVVGANEPEYNVTDVEATLTGSDTLEYEVSGSPATPATGTITLEFTEASVEIESEEVGTDQALAFDAALRLQSPIVGVDDVGRVDFDEIGNAADQETLDELRDRLLERIQNPIANFNVAQIEALARSVPGVTRVFVLEITPAVGQVTIYFMRDNDASGPIPSGSEVAAVDAVIQAKRPATSDAADVLVAAPTPVSTDFTFTAISPNTEAMKTAVEQNLVAFFAERTDVGADVVEEAYISAIFNTIDPTTGTLLESFTLSAPSGDIVVAAGEIAVLGNVSFP